MNQLIVLLPLCESYCNS